MEPLHRQELGEKWKKDKTYCRYFPFFTISEAQQLGKVCHAFQSRADDITLCFLRMDARETGNDFDLPSTLCLTVFFLTNLQKKNKQTGEADKKLPLVLSSKFNPTIF